MSQHLPTEQQSRMNGFHRRARAIHAFQLAGAIEDENAVRHRIERRFPFGLSARDHLEQLGLCDADGQTFCERLDQRQLIFRPERLRSVWWIAENAAKLTLHDQRVVDCRADFESLCLRHEHNR